MITAIVILAAVFLTLALSLLNTRSLPPEELKENSEFVDKYLMILTAVYGIFLAFVITNLWATNDKAVSLVNSEASEIVYSAMLTSGTDVATQQQILGRLHDYADSVIHTEWPVMQRGAGGQAVLTFGTYDLLFESVSKLPVNSEEARDARNRLLDAVHEIGDERRTRLMLSEDRLTPFLKWAVILGAVATVLPITYIRERRWRFHIVGSLCAVGLLTMMVCLVFDLSGEYTGPTQISVQPFHTALEKVDYIAHDPRWRSLRQAVEGPGTAPPQRPPEAQRLR